MDYPDFIQEWRNTDSFIKVHTSGSTGIPKEIKLDKDFVRESGRRTINFFKLNENSHLHSCISPDFIGGKMMAVRAEMLECKFSWEKPSNQSLSALCTRDSALDLVAVVPSQMKFIIENQDNLPIIKNIIVGGAPIPMELRIKIAKSGLNAYETYGMTETASHIALRKICECEDYFKVLDGIAISTDNRGCLVISMAGKEISTNDLAEIKGDNEFKILGRIDNMIITGAKKVNPLDIENALAEIISVPFMITGFPDEKWGEKIVLLLQAKANQLISRDNLMNQMRTLLPSWQVPKEILFVSSFPTTANGKLKRSKLREDYSFVQL